MKDKENRQFHIRSRGLVAVLAAVLIGFGYVLYDLQTRLNILHIFS